MGLIDSKNLQIPRKRLSQASPETETATIHGEGRGPFLGMGINWHLFVPNPELAKNKSHWANHP